MRLQQKVGPFKNGQVIFNKTNVTYLQIGIEHPHSIPISEIDINDINTNYRNSVMISINKSGNIMGERDFVLTEKDILEFRMNKDTVSIAVWETNNPYIIINLAYEDAS